MNKFWDRFFYFFTFLTQGSSFLNPRAYAILHRMHHAYSDTEKDPHSPYFFRSIWHMMMETKKVYQDYAQHKIEPEKAFAGNYPEWKFIDKISDIWVVRIAFGVSYFIFYYYFAEHWWQFLFLPIHFLMGPIHGAIVNWCGHKYGYENYDNKDHSKNTLPIDFLMMGELFQNNHHKSANNPNFAQKWYELDPTWPMMKVLNFIGIIKLRK